MRKLISCFIVLFVAAPLLLAAGYPQPQEADYVITHFRFGAGETLPALNIHYRTLGPLRKDTSGRAANAVLDIFAPELGVLEKNIRAVPKGRAIIIPMSEKTRGHGTHTIAAVWKQHLVDFLAATEPAHR